MPVARTPEWARRGDVTAEIVERRLCIGCGVCVAACPSGRLNMVLAHGGAQVPQLAAAPCDAACGSCLAVCPFWPGNPNEDSIAEKLFGSCSYVDGVGYHRGILAGHSADENEHLSGSSGGLGTLLTRWVLESGVADAVILAGTSAAGRDSYAICRDSKCIGDHAGSRYAPLCAAEALAEVRSNSERAVIVAVPCVAKAIRLLCERVPAYHAAVVGVIGLACGHTKRPDFWSFIGQRAGLDASRVRVARYRVKRENRRASDFAVRLETCDIGGTARSATLSWLEDVAPFWSHKWFTMNACLFCDDMMAECADVTLMDAWLPRYVSDWRGTTLAITRSTLVDGALDTTAGLLVSEQVTAQEALESQKDALAWKRQGLALRVGRSTPFGGPIPGWKRGIPAERPRLSEYVRWMLDSWIAAQTSQFTVPLRGDTARRAAWLRLIARLADAVASVLRKVGA